MKNQLLIISLVLLLCFALSCQNKAEKAELAKFRAQAELEAQNKKIAYLEVEKLWNEGRLEVADQVYAPHQILHFRGGSGPFGPAEGKAVVSA